MPQRLLILADPLERLKPRSDTSIALAEAALARRWSVGFSTFEGLRRQDADLSAAVRPIVRLDAERRLEAGAARIEALEDFDVILVRTDPPVGAQYVTALQLLGGLVRPLVHAPPGALLGFNEKLMTPRLAALGPPTLVSQDRAALLAFAAEHGEVVLKTLVRGGGSGVVRLSTATRSVGAVVDLYLSDLREPVLMQAFLPAVFAQEKRIVMIDGEIAGGIVRTPAADDFRANLAVGGTAQLATFTDAEAAICRAVGEELQRLGILFAGIDVIGERLTEVNITSPTGLRAIEALGGGALGHRVLDALEARLARTSETVR
jgi:glutathione synthase